MESGITTIVYVAILAMILGTLFFAIFFREDPDKYMKRREDEK
ncbi:photosystem II reaction center protein T [Candidatus Cyanaurora vandensis]|nr:photosystem II reaction center protein T [Candidatus Cyanaurora vandensis]